MFVAEQRRVLLVDDNEATRTLIKAILQRDFIIEQALDGKDAIDKLHTNQYATILLDLRMPEHDGFTVLDFLKANQPEMLPHVLVVTASLASKDLNRARSYGVADIVAKPFDVESLLEAVKKCAGVEEKGTRINMMASAPIILFIADLLKDKIS